jgi:L-fucose isomerase-like protein
MNCYPDDGKHNLEDAARIDHVLQKLIRDHQLDALTVECFSLVNEHSVTACLGLSHINDLGVPAGCEGDICSITGMMLVKEVTGQMPWMANLARIKGKEVLFAHCTAPTSLLEDFNINTHFETGKGTAVEGRFGMDEVTVFRVNNTLDRAFLCHGSVVDGNYEKNACRTQMFVELDEVTVAELRANPLGNHHLILPGNVTEELEMLFRILDITVINS